ncbi:MAG: capsule assembly Wzi family protein [Prevotella fusca]|uniref:capsule assembly Wzi family protein n=1 Tax=Prevotella fusca TaxID=589436 RepID=UPI003FA054B9
MKKFLSTLVVLLVTSTLQAQYQEPVRRDTSRLQPLHGLEYKVEMQGSLSKGRTPLWLNANKYGLSSLETANGYVRGGIERPLSTDEGRKFGLGYGLDVAIPINYTSKAIIQQAYVEGRWLHGTLTVGAKEEPMELKNNELSSGSQTLGVNARPVPQVRLALSDYWTLPFGNGWMHLKGHVAYGMVTDQNWQHDFTQQQSKFTDRMLYHSKAGYLKIGNEEVFCPWSLEMGLEMVSLFGGTSYLPDGHGGMKVSENGKGVRDFWHAFLPGGADNGETTYQNVQGDQLGSWVMRLNYDGDWHGISLYADKFFEDHSSMLQLDYDGYGEGDEWQMKKERRYLIYDFKDWMLGFEYRYKPDNWLNNIVFEYLYSKYQSGPIYHDHTKTVGDHIGGKDNFYNHYILPGYQHWGQAMGNPLYRSPIYNEDGTIFFKDNRFVAFHLGLGGHPTENFKWRFLGTWQEGLGTYEIPYTKKRHNVSLMGEATYTLQGTKMPEWMRGVDVRMGVGADFGSILRGNNYGMQLTITKRGLLGKK